jgi:hypothetical protein
MLQNSNIFGNNLLGNPCKLTGLGIVKWQTYHHLQGKIGPQIFSNIQFQSPIKTAIEYFLSFNVQYI